MPDVTTFVLVIVLPVALIILAMKTLKVAIRLAILVALAALIYYFVAPYLEQVL